MRATVIDIESGIQCTTDGPDSWEWDENSWSFDCNRASMFSQDIGCVCQSKRFLVIDAKFVPEERRYSLNELNSGYPKDVFDEFVKNEPTMNNACLHPLAVVSKTGLKCQVCDMPLGAYDDGVWSEIVDIQPKYSNGSELPAFPHHVLPGEIPVGTVIQFKSEIFKMGPYGAWMWQR